jgi:hypothetical protein
MALASHFGQTRSLGPNAITSPPSLSNGCPSWTLARRRRQPITESPYPIYDSSKNVPSLRPVELEKLNRHLREVAAQERKRADMLEQSLRRAFARVRRREGRMLKSFGAASAGTVAARTARPVMPFDPFPARLQDRRRARKFSCGRFRRTFAPSPARCELLTTSGGKPST